MDPALSLPLGTLVAGSFTIVFLLLLPVAATIAAHHWLQVGWRYALYGAAVFLVFQILTRIPAVEIFGPRVLAYVQHSPLLWGWLAVLALTAGVFEEVGRYLGFRVFFRSDQKTWSKAVMFGIGHGGLEALMVAATAIFSTAQLWALSRSSLDSLGPAQRQQVLDQFARIAAQPAWIQLLGAWERTWAMLIQIAMALIVLQVFTRRRLIWLWLAIAAHAVVDMVSVSTVQLLSARPVAAYMVTEVLVGLFGLAALWTIIRLRDIEAARLQLPAGGRPARGRRWLHAAGHP